MVDDWYIGILKMTDDWYIIILKMAETGTL